MKSLVLSSCEGVSSKREIQLLSDPSSRIVGSEVKRQNQRSEPNGFRVVVEICWRTSFFCVFRVAAFRLQFLPVALLLVARALRLVPLCGVAMKPPVPVTSALLVTLGFASTGLVATTERAGAFVVSPPTSSRGCLSLSSRGRLRSVPSTAGLPRV